MTKGSFGGITNRRGGRTKRGRRGERGGEMSRRSWRQKTRRRGEFLYVSVRSSNVVGSEARTSDNASAHLPMVHLSE